MPATDARQMVTVKYKQVGGLDLLVDVWAPAGDGPHPVVVYLHGGGLINGSRRSIPRVQLATLIDDGFVVASGDYRLAPETKLPAIATDVDDLLTWIRGPGAQRFALDAGRVGVLGHSAGAYLSLLVGARVRPPVQALIAFYGYGDVDGDWYARPDPFYRAQGLIEEAVARAAVGRTPISVADGDALWRRRPFYLFCRQQGLWPLEVGGVDLALDAGGLDPWCPVRHVDASFPPTLLLHGDQDTDVPHQQSVDMAAALEAAGVPHELLTIHGAGHGFDEDATRPDVAAALTRVRAFLRSAIGP